MRQQGSINWDAHPDATKLLLQLREQGKSYSKIAEALYDEFGFELNEHQAKRAYNRMSKKFGITKEAPKRKTNQTLEDIAENVDMDLSYKETVEIGSDGSHKSDKLLQMSAEQSKDVNFLLEAHGYDTEEWELVSSRSNTWNAYSKQDGIMTLYASKITVRPRNNGFSMEKLLDEIRKVPAMYIKKNSKDLDDKRLLEIPFFDSHFGVSDFEYYQKTQDDTMNLIASRHWEEILFVIGQDMLHNDNFKGQTANGTPIETVDMPNAWRDAKRFYYPLIEEALNKANHVKVIFSKGNHDESMSWAFTQLIMERYPQVEVDDHFEERKCHTFGEIFIGITHGDKAKKNLHNLFQVEFPLEWAQAKIREIHSGHLHVEDSRDWFGMMVRTLATRNKTDRWHKDNGFVGAHKRFQLFEYNESELKSIYYV